MARWQVDSGIILNTPFPAASLTLPQGLDIHSTLAPPSFRVWSPTPTTEDVIVLAEFSEIEGPVPLLTIPKSPAKHLDLNDFVVKILSTDYLNTSGEFRIYEDTQLVQQDLSPGIHVYVHYFTLYDVRARGFVRPMCLSYISADYRKLTRYFSQLRQHFILATEYLKLSNYEWFSKEIVGLMRNLEYTKDRYILAQRNASAVAANALQDRPSSSPETDTKDETMSQVGKQGGQFTSFETTSASVVMTIHLNDDSPRVSVVDATLQSKDTDGMDGVLSIIEGCEDEGEEDEAALLRHTSLESMATQLLECQHILSVLKPHIDKKEIQDDLKCLSEQIMSKPQCPLYKAMKDLSMFDKPEEGAKPTICILSLMRRSFHNMRTIQQLCRVGYIACLFKLRFIFDKYCKSFSTLMFEDLDDEIYKNPFSSLFIGNIPIARITRGQPYKPSVLSSSYSALCWDTHFIKLLRNGSSNVSTPDSEFCQAVEAPHDSSTVSAAADCLKVFSRGEEEEESVEEGEEEEEEEEGENEKEEGEKKRGGEEDKKSVGEKEKSKGEDGMKWEGEEEKKREGEKEKEMEGDEEERYMEAVHSGSVIADKSVHFLNKQVANKDKPQLGEERNIEDSVSSQSTSHKNTTKESRGINEGVSSAHSTSSSGCVGQTVDLSSYEDIQEEEGVGEEVWAVVDPDAAPRLSVDNRMIISKVCRLSGLVQQFCGVSHCLLHALLSGRPVILAAADNYRPMVTLYVQALTTLLPRAPATQLPILKWHTGTITEHHLREYRVMGVCIPERLHVQDLMSNTTLNQVTVLNIETGHISGVAYSGNLVRGVEQYGRRLFHSNSALQASIQSILVSLGLKVYLLYHLLQTTNRSSSDILKGIGVAKGDYDIVTYLVGMVQKQGRSRDTHAKAAV